VVGRQGDQIKVRLAAPPVDGAANEALIALLAGLLAVARSAIRIKSGATSRRKTVVVAGVTLEEARCLLTEKPRR
jgi:uncharacterized protein YggU (UPF0235/DUF167 family)